MKEIAAIILENDKGEFLLYLRDNKPDIPFPDHWDLIGGHVEEGETPEEALIREVKEELDIDLKDYTFYKKYECLTGDAYENIKYIYYGKINLSIEEITLLEGVRPQYFSAGPLVPAGARSASATGRRATGPVPTAGAGGADGHDPGGTGGALRSQPARRHQPGVRTGNARAAAREPDPFFQGAAAGRCQRPD